MQLSSLPHITRIQILIRQLTQARACQMGLA